MFKIRIYQGCMPEGNYLEFDIPSSILYEVCVSANLCDHAVSIIEFDSPESPLYEIPNFLKK